MKSRVDPNHTLVALPISSTRIKIKKKRKVANALYLPDDKKQKVVMQSFFTFRDNRGTVVDVESYIKNSTNYSLPKRTRLTGALKSLISKGKVIACFSKKVKVRDLQEYRLRREGEEVPKRAKRKREDILAIKESVAKKQKLVKLPTQDIRQREFIFCKHCRGVYYLLPVKDYPGHFKHTCTVEFGQCFFIPPGRGRSTRQIKLSLHARPNNCIS